jgi:L-lactate utilization protein LutC
MDTSDETTKPYALAELFSARAQALCAKVSRVKDTSAAKALVARIQAECGAENTGVAQAALGIAETGTCVVETDDEETRLSTMLPETSVIILNASTIVPDLADIAPYLRERQKDGAISYTSLISGPSRTADIERVGAIGVHGPLNVHIILVED